MDDCHAFAITARLPTIALSKVSTPHGEAIGGNIEKGFVPALAVGRQGFVPVWT